MKIVPRSAPLLRRLVAVAATAACLGASGQVGNSAKRILHNDGTVTESVSDLAKGELREAIYQPPFTSDGRGVLQSRRVVLLNEGGQPVQGVIYGGNDEMVGRVEFIYDDLGRLSEERNLNAQGQVFRRKFQSYEQSGKALPEKIVDYPAYAPKVQGAKINFTNVVPPPGQNGAASQQPSQPGQTPQIQTVSPRNKPKTDEKKKKGFFDFLKK